MPLFTNLPPTTTLLLLLSLFPLPVQLYCYDPSPAFHPPPPHAINPNSPVLQAAFNSINSTIASLISSPAYDTSSFSIEVTSTSETLWSLYHTANDRDSTRPGAPEVQSDSVYRIASITKVFTVLGILQLQQDGKVSLEDTIDQYVAEFRDYERHSGSIRWNEITLRSLASQLSGIPREFAQGDLIILPNPTDYGLPPVSHDGLIDCDTSGGHKRPCVRKDMINNLVTRDPVFEPNWKSTYSNIAFNLLGLVIENATGIDYTSYIENFVLEPLGMNQTSMVKPEDNVAVLPKPVNYWDIDEGVERPMIFNVRSLPLERKTDDPLSSLTRTGSLYSSSHDLSIFLRYLLTHYNTPANIHPAINWFLPSSHATTPSSFIGMPWEILHSTSPKLHQKLSSPSSTSSSSSNRPITFVTKSGGLPGYYSIIILMPDYDVGITFLVGGTPTLLSRLREIVTVPIVRALEEIAQERLQTRYTGTFTAAGDLNTSMTIEHSTENGGLYISRFVSNGTNMMHVVINANANANAAFASAVDLLHRRVPGSYGTMPGMSQNPLFLPSSSHHHHQTTTQDQAQAQADEPPYIARLIPTLLHPPPSSSSSPTKPASKERERQGTLWRILNVPQKTDTEEVWNDFCITDEDPLYYAGVSLMEIVFWEDGEDKVMNEIELPGFRVVLSRE